MTPDSIPAWVVAIFTVVVVIVGFLQIRQWRRSMRRQREAAAMVRQGRDPADAANAVGMPFAQKIVFVGMARLFGKTIFDNVAVASEVLGVPAPRSTVTSHRYHLTLTTGETLVVNSATSIDDALSKAAVHPANLVTHYTDAE